MKRICWICGGSGAFTGLRGISRLDGIKLTVLTTTCDSGGAQGVILAGDPHAIALADPMKCLVALATDDTTARLYRHRFEGERGDGLSDHRQTVGNVVWYGLLKMGMSPRDAIAYMARHLGVLPHHQVEPIAVDRTDLCVQLEDGSIIRGEAQIDVPAHDGKLRISQAWLEPRVTTTTQVVQAIAEADLVVIGPGDLFSSLVACLLPEGVKEALQRTRARLLYVVSLMTKWGETTNFKVSDLVGVVEHYAGRRLDHILCNLSVPFPEVLAAYSKERATLVVNDFKDDSRVTSVSLLLYEGHVVRHHPRLGGLVAMFAEPGGSTVAA